MLGRTYDKEACSAARVERGVLDLLTFLPGPRIEDNAKSSDFSLREIPFLG